MEWLLHSMNKKISSYLTAALLAVLAVMVGMAVRASGQATPTIPPLQKGNPFVAQGRTLYRQERCNYCHRLKGHGGSIGPALDDVGFRRTTGWLADHFRNPQKVSKNSKMAVIPLKDDQVKSLTAYMNSLGGRVFSSKAPDLFQQYCTSCHKINGIGINPAAQDLSNEGEFRDVDFLNSYIQDPVKLNPNSRMPGFQNRLTKAQIKDLAIYVMRGGK
jgi:mono/diheme cytochrome c family protein